MTLRLLDVESSKPLWVAVAALTAGSDADPAACYFWQCEIRVREMRGIRTLHSFDNIAMRWSSLGALFGGHLRVSAQTAVILGLTLLSESEPWVIRLPILKQLARR